LSYVKQPLLRAGGSRCAPLARLDRSEDADRDVRPTRTRRRYETSLSRICGMAAL